MDGSVRTHLPYVYGTIVIVLTIVTIAIMVALWRVLFIFGVVLGCTVIAALWLAALRWLVLPVIRDGVMTYKLARSRYLAVAPDRQGNYTEMLDMQTGRVVGIAPGQRAERAHITVEADEVPALDAPQIEPPTRDWLMSQVEDAGELVYSPGIDEQTGKPIFVSVLDTPHSKIIGGSGGGKSTLTFLVIDQLSTFNPVDRLQIAVLDLENKTSKLFRGNKNIFEAQVGRRRVPIFASNIDHVLEYLGYLKDELDRRTQLSEIEVSAEPVILIYIEEMLSLQLEATNKNSLAVALAEIQVLAIRGRKYGMYLMACSQTDYSTKELQIAQKMFRFRAAAGIDESAARAAGFRDNALMRDNFLNFRPGRFMVEFPGFSGMILVPKFEIKSAVREAESALSASFQRVPHSDNVLALKGPRNAPESDLKSPEKVAQVRNLLALDWGKTAIIDMVWAAKPGGSKLYKQAEQAYEEIVSETALEA